ncbi:hypothetical protein GQ55_8G179300 [Panicum hallii var. hallii]|uniref:Uncharacterized protein n=1 Tax=Panicum hallii var. hallii TaxID=1504633 RepID=A0A2T7CNP8_9POAL|nr:hypothetical protein GQ55_8G179300 [Panicum hallii var. hallii]
MMRPSCKILVARYWAVDQSPRITEQTRKTRENPQLYFLSACLAEAAAIIVGAPISPQSMSPSGRPSSPPHAALAKSLNTDAGTVAAPQLQCRRGRRAAQHCACAQASSRCRLRPTPPTSITASLRNTPAHLVLSQV